MLGRCPFRVRGRRGARVQRSGEVSPMERMLGIGMVSIVDRDLDAVV
jgi:hypothetical protein